MNAINKEILTEMLKAPEFWEPIKENRLVTGHRLKLRRVFDELRTAKEIMFYDRVLFPRTQRMMRLVKAMGIVPEHVGWQEREVGINQIFMIWYPSEIAWQEYLSDYFSSYFQDIWENDEWCCEEPSESELLALGIRPDSMTAIQEKLF